MLFVQLLIVLSVFAVVSVNAFQFAGNRGAGKRFVARTVLARSAAGSSCCDTSAKSHCKGYSVLKNPLTNKGTSFTHEERSALGIRGLVPAGEPLSLEDKVDLAMAQLRKKTSPIEKYSFLHTIQDSDETLFYAMLTKHTAEAMPLVYTPTVGQACQEWSHIYRQQPRGLYLSVKDVGHVKEILKNHPNKDVKVIVFTDGERILGLGDLGANGMGIPVGKLALYTTCAGIHPKHCLPVLIDAGTNTESIRNDKAYIGLRQPRDRSEQYDKLLNEFFDAAKEVYGRTVLLQFEDFGNSNAFRLLEHNKDKMTCFNDDIQGTASVVLAGLFSSLPLCDKKKLAEHKFLFMGAGEAGIGIGELIAMAIKQETGCSIEEARSHCWFVDSKGLITNARLGGKIEHHKIPYAHNLPGEAPTSLAEAVKAIKPTALIGVSAQGGAFSEEVIKEMGKNNKHPLVFALSNPTSKAECTAEQAYTWTNGQAVFASGSPFDPVTLPDGRHFVPGQGNNAYIFPGVGLGVLAAQATTITDEDFLVAAKALASLVGKDRLDIGCAYPDLKNIRHVSQHIAVAVAKYITESGRSSVYKSDAHIDWSKTCAEMMYHPSYSQQQ